MFSEYTNRAPGVGGVAPYSQNGGVNGQRYNNNRQPNTPNPPSNANRMFTKYREAGPAIGGVAQYENAANNYRINHQKNRQDRRQTEPFKSPRADNTSNRPSNDTAGGGGRMFQEYRERGRAVGGAAAYENAAGNNRKRDEYNNRRNTEYNVNGNYNGASSSRNNSNRSTNVNNNRSSSNMNNRREKDNSNSNEYSDDDYDWEEEQIPFNYPRENDDNLLFQDFKGPGRRQMDPTRYQQPNGRRNDERELYSDYKEDYYSSDQYNDSRNNKNRRRNDERNANLGRNSRRDYRNDYENPVPGDMGYDGSNRGRETPSQRSINSSRRERREYRSSNVRYDRRMRDVGTNYRTGENVHHGTGIISCHLCFCLWLIDTNDFGSFFAQQKGGY